MKEEHYVNYFESLHNLAENNASVESLRKYTLHRDKLFIIAGEKVVKSILKHEDYAVGKRPDLHDQFLTNIVKAIRKDLKIKDKVYPQIYMKKSGGSKNRMAK